MTNIRCILRQSLFAAIAGYAMLGGLGPVRAEAPAGDGIVRVQSAYSFSETVRRLKDDIEKKGIMFFSAVDQAKLGAGAKITLKPSTLLIFGNPPLGIHFLTANPNAGLDWPVRLLVTQDERGQVWMTYTDFGWIAKRHRITNREAEFKMASEVIASITSAAAAPASH